MLMEYPRTDPKLLGLDRPFLDDGCDAGDGTSAVDRTTLHGGACTTSISTVTPPARTRLRLKSGRERAEHPDGCSTLVTGVTLPEHPDGLPCVTLPEHPDGLPCVTLPEHPDGLLCVTLPEAEKSDDAVPNGFTEKGPALRDGVSSPQVEVPSMSFSDVVQTEIREDCSVERIQETSERDVVLQIVDSSFSNVDGHEVGVTRGGGKVMSFFDVPPLCRNMNLVMD